jgi:hypothetical protein
MRDKKEKKPIPPADGWVKKYVHKKRNEPFYENAAEAPILPSAGRLPALYHIRFRACRRAGAGTFTS